MNIDTKKKILKLEIRKKIYYMILKFPGIHFNELLRKGDFASGQLSHHLYILEKNKLIYKVKGKVVNYYSLENFDLNDELYLKYLRDPKKRKIIKLILENDIVSFHLIEKELGLVSSTVSWHLNDLVKNNILLSDTQRKKKYYYFNEEISNKFKELLHNEKKSVLSNLVDSFIDLWD